MRELFSLFLLASFFLSSVCVRVCVYQGSGLCVCVCGFSQSLSLYPCTVLPLTSLLMQLIKGKIHLNLTQILTFTSLTKRKPFRSFQLKLQFFEEKKKEEEEIKNK